MSDEPKKPPPGEYSAFKELLDKIAKVPKEEVEELEQTRRKERDEAKGRRPA